MKSFSVYPSLPEFKRLSRKGNLVPMYIEVIADHITPVGLLASKWGKSQECFLLESVIGGERIGRYSILGFDPKMVIEEGSNGTFVRNQKESRVIRFDGSALNAIRYYHRKIRPVRLPNLPAFVGGSVGFSAYETIQEFEKIPASQPDAVGWPRATYFITDNVFVFDNSTQTLKIITNVTVDKNKNSTAAYRKAAAYLQNVGTELLQLRAPNNRAQGRSSEGDFVSNTTKPEFVRAVKAAKNYISAGDIIQVVLSRRLTKKTTASPLDIYRCLRVVNPSPYMYLMKMGSRAIIGSSPESLVKLTGRHASTRPIAGTRPRGRTEKEDLDNAEQLLKDPKERAEHIMLVDLGRNDIGRVSVPGSVHVPVFMKIERYSHVMHIVSEVQGKLQPGKDAFDLLRASFPAGTVSGAPKIRAMEIINELEKSQRGPYAGALGYFSYSGDMDVAITIRTLLWDKGVVSIQSGAGIVADSNPVFEWAETQNKAAGMKRAVQMAENQMVFWK